MIVGRQSISEINNTVANNVHGLVMTRARVRVVHGGHEEARKKRQEKRRKEKRKEEKQKTPALYPIATSLISA